MVKNRSILIVDDEPKILEVVESYLHKNGYDVFTAKTGAEALKILENSNISLIILDLMLPDTTGEDICRRVRSFSDIPIIMMTAKVDEESIINGLELGADDYVTKPFSPRQLMARVCAALRRPKAVEERSVIKSGGLTVDTQNKVVYKDDVELQLTPNEYKILTLLISNPGKVYSRDEIILKIKNEEFEGFDRAIDSHIKNLRHKIETDPKSPKYVITVYGMGYKFGGDIDNG